MLLVGCVPTIKQNECSRVIATICRAGIHVTEGVVCADDRALAEGPERNDGGISPQWGLHSFLNDVNYEEPCSVVWPSPFSSSGTCVSETEGGAHIRL